jgi:enoyl-CoA hydratase
MTTEPPPSEAPEEHRRAVTVAWPSPEIAVVTIDRAERLNALDYDMVDSLATTFTTATIGRDCRAVVLTGAGRGFCAGLDLRGANERERSGGRGPVDRLEGQERFAQMVRAIRALRQPVIAAVNGPAAGAGMALALACDVRVMAASAQLHVASVRLGISAGECGISYHLPRHIGSGRAFEILLTGRPLDAAEAERLGLVTAVVPDGEVLAAAIATADRIRANSPFAVWQTKRLMWANLDSSFEQAIDLENRTQVLGTLTEDHGEAVAAFVERRDAHFSGA